MKFMGSKNRIARYILPIILKDRKDVNQYYVEPFVGGCNCIDKVKGNRIGSDINPYLIELWKGLQRDITFPNTIERDLYTQYKALYTKDKLGTSYPDDVKALIGWCGFMGSYNGKFYDGGYSGHNVKGRNYIGEQMRNTLSQVDAIKDIEFVSSDYRELSIPDNSIIYCDIPYENTTQYAYSTKFNHIDFWNWCREMKEQGHQIFISSYIAPDDFSKVWSMEVTNSMHPTKTTKPLESLFTL